MTDFLKRIKMNSLISAALYAALGLVLLVWPMASANALCWALGALLLVCGAVDIILYLKNRDGTLFSSVQLIFGIILAALGVWIIASPQLVSILVPRVIGVLILIHGIGDVRDAFTIRRSGVRNWTSALIFGIGSILFGAILIFDTFAAMSTMIRIIGVFLLYDGGSDIWIAMQVKKAFRLQQQDAKAKTNAKDVDFTDINE